MGYILSGVANVDLYDGNELFAQARTLVDSSINISVTADAIRGGAANALIGQYFHDSAFGMKLTDALFNIEYIAAHTGSDLIKGGDVFMDESDVVAGEDGTVTLKATAVPMINGGATYAYARKATETVGKPKKYLVNGENKITGLEAGATYCIRYMYTNAAATKLVVSSQFIPKTLYAMMYVNIYAADASAIGSGTKAGQVVIKVPRYQLSGTTDISMTATGAAQTSLEGNALRTNATGCDDVGSYAEIVQVILDERWYSEASGLIIEDSYIEANAADFKPSTPVVYAWYDNARPKQISNAILASQESNLADNEKSKLVFSIEAGTTGLTIDASTGAIGGTAAAGTAMIKVVAQKADGSNIEGMDASASIVLA